MALQERLKCDLNDVKVVIFLKKLRKSPGDWGLCPKTSSIIHWNCISLLNMPPELQYFLNRIILLLVQVPKQNLGCSCKVLFHLVEMGYFTCSPLKKFLWARLLPASVLREVEAKTRYNWTPLVLLCPYHWKVQVVNFANLALWNQLDL